MFFHVHHRSEYGAFWKCVQASGIYVFTQLCKMLVLATFFPDTTANNLEDMNLLSVCRTYKLKLTTKHSCLKFLIFDTQELLRCTIDIADLLGLAIVLSRIPGKGHSKLITAGLGWATAEVILSRGLLLWVGARGAEFSWLYIQKCLESNISLVNKHLSIALKSHIN